MLNPGDRVFITTPICGKRAHQNRTATVLCGFDNGLTVSPWYLIRIDGIEGIGYHDGQGPGWNYPAEKLQRIG